LLEPPIDVVLREHSGEPRLALGPVRTDVAADDIAVLLLRELEGRAQREHAFGPVRDRYEDHFHRRFPPFAPVGWGTFLSCVAWWRVAARTQNRSAQWHESCSVRRNRRILGGPHRAESQRRGRQPHGGATLQRGRFEDCPTRRDAARRAEVGRRGSGARAGRGRGPRAGEGAGSGGQARLLPPDTLTGRLSWRSRKASPAARIR